MGKRVLRVGAFSGYLGDRFTALEEVLAGDPVDVLIGDYLAEITLAGLAARHRNEADGGYVEAFVDQLRPLLPTVAERGVRIVTNAGGFNPAALARALRAEAATAGVAVRIAHVEGDNLLPRLPDLLAAGHRFEHLDTGAGLAEWGVEPVVANAYLGGWGIVEALRAGADIVVCGRVTDASLVLGPAAWWHGWGTEDWDALAGAVVAGHVIECGPHATGGNFSGFATVPGVEHAGFPVAEIEADGSSVITKHARDGGAVTVDTVTAQVVYEIQGPLYLNPDVTVHIDSVRLRADGPDRVRIDGVHGSPPPPTAKVALFAPVGYQTVQTVFVTAPDVEEKVELLRRQVRAIAGPGVDQIDVTPLGQVPVDPATQWEATVPVRIMATARFRDALAPERFARQIFALYLSSVPGFFLDNAAPWVPQPQPRVDYWPALLPRELVEHRAVLDDGTLRTAAQPAVAEVVPQPRHDEPAEAPGSEATVRRPLGEVAYARSGDKGGNSNVGIWARDERAWPWLRGALTVATLRALVPEVKDLEVVRHEFPHLHAVHFVLKGLLGSGGSSNLRVDPVGKAVGEYIRAKHVSIPAELLGGTDDRR
jgi:hypothetical protein